MEIIGYFASLFIGISLGLIGGGGSILTMPILVYLFHIEPVQATAYSLFIVGITSFIGVGPKYKQNLVDVRTALIFGAPAILTVFIIRKFVIPIIPEHLFTIGDITVDKSVFIMVLFAILMLGASIAMIREKKETCVDCDQTVVFNYPIILLEGILVGSLTGLVGAGGGFLIIPALVMLSKLPMKKAIGTSLLIIGTQSLIGFTGDLSHTAMNWTLLISVSMLAITGFFIGNTLSKKISAHGLKKGFGWFVLAMGVYIISKELFL